jgi:hypothetical protein
MAACRSSSENRGKMNSISVLNKTLPWAHMESELDVLGEICSSLVQKNKIKKYIFLHRSYPNNNQPIFGLEEF